MENTLRGAVLTKFSSITAFADAMNWDRKKASRVVNRVQKPSADDMEKIADVIGIHEHKQFIDVFFPHLSTKWES